MRIELVGKEAHSSMPESGVSPLAAINRLSPQLTALGGGSFTQDDFAMAEGLVEKVAQEERLNFAFDYHEIFVASQNDEEATAHLATALDDEGISHDREGLPMRASEDFGAFGHGSKSAMLFLGAGIDRPNLHNPDYDFPDELIAIGARIFMRVSRNLLG